MNKSIIEQKITEENRIKSAERQGFDVNTIWYHVSNNDFEFFDLDKSSDNAIWLTNDLDEIKNGTTGASIQSDNVYIHEFYIKAKKIGGWTENDNLMDEQLVQDGYDGLLLDDAIKLFNPDNIRKTNFDFTLEENNTNPELNNKTIFYHGNENKKHHFYESAPCFFSTEREYSEQYGDYVYEYNLEINKIFDTSTDEVARNYYNTDFLNHELGIDAVTLKENEMINANTADNFWAFLAVEEITGQGFGYDSIMVNEGSKALGFDTDISIIPLDTKQIKAIRNKKNKLKNNTFKP